MSPRMRKPRLTALALNGLRDALDHLTAGDLDDELASGNITSISAIRAADKWVQEMRAWMQQQRENKAGDT